MSKRSLVSEDYIKFESMNVLTQCIDVLAATEHTESMNMILTIAREATIKRAANLIGEITHLMNCRAQRTGWDSSMPGHPCDGCKFKHNCDDAGKPEEV